MSTPPLPRRFGLLQATALNMIDMIGIGPFITIPLLMTALGGPQAMLGWIVALVIVICDGMVWSELGAAMPGLGRIVRLSARGVRPRDVRPVDGVSVRVAVHPERTARNRLPGYIGFSQYLGYIWPGFSSRGLS